MAPSEPAPSSIGWAGRGVATRLRGGKSVLCAYGRISTVDGVTPQHDTSRARAAAKDRISRWIGGVEVARAQAWSCRGSGRPAAAAAYLDRARRRGVAPLSRCGRVGASDGVCRAVARALRALVPCPWLVASYVYDAVAEARRAYMIQSRDHDAVYILAFFRRKLLSEIVISPLLL